MGWGLLHEHQQRTACDPEVAYRVTQRAHRVKSGILQTARSCSLSSENREQVKPETSEGRCLEICREVRHRCVMRTIKGDGSMVVVVNPDGA